MTASAVLLVVVMFATRGHRRLRRRFRLHEPERRRVFLHSGRLGRDLVA